MFDKLSVKRKDSPTLKSVKDVNDSKKSQKTVNLILASSVLVLAFMVATEDTVAVVTPPQFSEELRVSQNQANEHYKVMWAFAGSALAGNINEDNAEFVVDQLGRMFSPYLKDAILPSIEREAQIVAARKAEQTFKIEDAIYEPKNDIVFVWGHKELEVDKSDKPSSQRWTYEFRIEPFTGRPAITHFDSYPGPPKSKSPDYKVEYNPIISQEIKQAMESTNPDAPVKKENTTNSGEDTNE